MVTRQEFKRIKGEMLTEIERFVADLFQMAG